MKWKAELDLAVKAANEAAQFLHVGFTEEKAVLSQIGRDIKLQADQDAEKRILDILAESAFPVLAEESGETGDVMGNTPFWIVDPLDGTMNYKHGIPLCCVSIALSLGYNPVLGVINDFNRGECFRGIAEEGGWIDDIPLKVSDVIESEAAILSTGFPVRRSMDRDSLDEFLGMAQKFKKVRMLGSAALMMAYVSCGRIDAYAEDDIMFWDIAAGAALIRAAGGWVHMQPSDDIKWGMRVRCASAPTIWPSA